MMISGGSSVYQRYRACHENPEPGQLRPSLPESPRGKVTDRERRDRLRAARARRP